jgi:hypothetical protein
VIPAPALAGPAPRRCCVLQDFENFAQIVVGCLERFATDPAMREILANLCSFLEASPDAANAVRSALARPLVGLLADWGIDDGSRTCALFVIELFVQQCPEVLFEDGLHTHAYDTCAGLCGELDGVEGTISKFAEVYGGISISRCTASSSSSSSSWPRAAARRRSTSSPPRGLLYPSM